MERITEENLLIKQEEARLMAKSHILSNLNGYNINSVVVWDKTNIEAELLMIVGDDKTGLYFKNREPHIAALPFVRQRINELKEAFIQLQLQAKNMGKEPPVMPVELVEKLSRYTAQQNILLEEKTELERRLKELAEKEEKENLSHLLEYGLKLVSRFHGSRAATPELMEVIAVMDGQRIVQDAEGQLIIDNGPYRGMDLPSYRKLAEQWRKNRDAADKAKLERLQEEAKAQGKPVPNILSFSSRKVDPKNLPPWPSWAVDHYKKDKS